MAYVEGTHARHFDDHPLTVNEARRISRLSGGLRILHTNGCIYDECPECEIIRELEQILVWRHGR